MTAVPIIKNCQRRELVAELYITIYEHLHLVLEPFEVLATQVADYPLCDTETRKREEDWHQGCIPCCPNRSKPKVKPMKGRHES
jgi:hypothetical protein